MSGSRFSNLEFDDKEARAAAGEAEAELPSAGPEKGTEPQHFVSAVKDAQYYIAKAVELEFAGEHEQALRSYSAALGENPLLLEAWVGQVLMLLELEEYAEARMWADKALEKFPDQPQLLAAKSVAVFRMGRQREARELNDAAVAGKGEAELVWLFRGELMLAKSRPAADDCLQRALQLSSRKGLTKLRIGALYFRYGKYSLALAALQEASASSPNSAWSWYLLGSAQKALGLFKQARTSYRQALELSPRNKTYQAATRRTGYSPGTLIIGLFRRLFNK